MRKLQQLPKALYGAADYLYDIFGTDQVKVVRGEQAELFENSMVITTSAAAMDTEKAHKSGGNTAWIAASIVVVLLGVALFARKLLYPRSKKELKPNIQTLECKLGTVRHSFFI